jgi:hypothetical protein
MCRYAYLDMYDYRFINSLDPSVTDTIELKFSADDLRSLADVSSEISGYDDRIYVEGRRFKRVSERASNIINGNIFLEIKVKEIKEYEQRL